jgi:predicted nucleotidyltransferase
MEATTTAHFNFDRVDRRTKKITPKLIASITRRIVHHLQPDKLVLFGSRAKGEATMGSDIDLLVVVSDDHTLAPLPRRGRFGKLLELFRYRSFGLDAIIVTESEVQALREQNEGEWDMVLDILEKGKTLYDRLAQAQVMMKAEELGYSHD